MEVQQAHCGHWIKAGADTDHYQTEQVFVHTETGMRPETRKYPVHLCKECSKKL